jgi:hypothetical protein
MPRQATLAWYPVQIQVTASPGGKMVLSWASRSRMQVEIISACRARLRWPAPFGTAIPASIQFSHDAQAAKGVHPGIVMARAELADRYSPRKTHRAAPWAPLSPTSESQIRSICAAEAPVQSSRCADLSIGPPRVFRTAKLMLIHAASCRFRYSSWTSCGVL